MDDGLKGWERLGPAPFRGRAIEAARRWLEERLAVPGGLGGIFPAMANAVLALRTLGYPDDHPLVRGQIKEIEALGVETRDAAPLPALRLAGLGHRRSPSTRWSSRGFPPITRSSCAAGEWMMDKQITVPGDWQVKRPHVQPGGWPFQYDNDFYPDLDDSAMVMMALAKTQGLDPERKRALHRARPHLVPRHAGRRRRLGLLRRRQRPAHLQQHSRSPITAPSSILRRRT